MGTDRTTSAVLVVGEALIDEVARDGSTEAHVGGSCLNVAVGLARLDHDTHLACWIADDDYGRQIARHLDAAGVGLAPGSVGASATPVAHASLDDAGHASYTFDIESDVPDLADVTGYGHLHAGSIAAALPPGAARVEETLGRARACATISYDPNVRPALMTDPAVEVARAERFAALADVVKASDEDLAWLYAGLDTEEAARRLLAQGPALVVVTRGGDGALALFGSGGSMTQPAGAATVADTVGAGDSFMAGLLSGLLDVGLLGGADSRDRLRRASEEELRPALARAARTAAITVGRNGAYAPDRAQLG